MIRLIKFQGHLEFKNLFKNVFSNFYGKLHTLICKTPASQQLLKSNKIRSRSQKVSFQGTPKNNYDFLAISYGYCEKRSNILLTKRLRLRNLLLVPKSYQKFNFFENFKFLMQKYGDNKNCQEFVAKLCKLRR